ncbi:pyocin knob domain-containing protein [Rhizobium sp. NFR03]|uniref:pyocin knob domain-containing protein n=1 Tax=Rhizobium sp. NFR03 TaxID=1566263 RepID=UPI001114FE56|nr:pyocin knob domain-containing protein [Rhizobium sp. NFR03]
MADARMAARVRSDSLPVADADAAVENGWYRCDPASLNTPYANFWILKAQRYDTTIHQEITHHQLAIKYRRAKLGTWTAWEQVLGGLTELDARYARINGNQNLFVTAAYAALVLSKTASGQASRVVGSTAGLTRWELALGDGSAESGSDAGSNCSLNAYTDAGAYKMTPWTVSRATGVMAFNLPVKLPSYTVSTLPSASIFNGCTIRVSNGAGGANLATSNGSVWQFAAGATVS